MRFYLAILSLLLPSFAHSHEMWLQPDASSAHLQIVVGQNFRGAQGVWIDHEVVLAQRVYGETRQTHVGRYGDRPAIRDVLLEPLDRVIYQSSVLSLTYNRPDKFQAFGEEKGYPNLWAEHQAMGKSEPIKEHYTRYAKYLQGADSLDPLRFQFVVINDTARLYLDREPVPGHLVHWYSGQQVVELITDASGLIALPASDQPQLLDAVWIEPSQNPEADWHSHWASTYIDR